MTSLGSLAARFWSAHAWSWDDRLADAGIRARIEELASWLLARIGGPAARVVDIGCGTGNHALALADGGAAVVGVDLAPGMLARAAAKLLGGGDGAPPDVLLARTDLRDGLPVRPASLDGALSVYSAQFLDLATFADEVVRVLRPGGVLVLELPRPGTKRAVRTDLSVRHRLFQRVNGAAAFVGERTGIVHVRSADEIDDALRRAGFEDLEHRDGDRSIAVRARKRRELRPGP